MKKWGQVFVLTGSIVAMLITGTGCSKKNTGIKNEKLASDYMELFNMSEGIKTEEGCFKIRDGICYYVDFGEEKAIPLCNKPECRHLSEAEDPDTECNAVSDEDMYIFPYGDRLFEIAENEDGTVLTSSALDRTDRKEVKQLMDIYGKFGQGVVVKNRLIYTVSKVADVQNAEELNDFTMTRSIECLNLDTLETEVYVDAGICDGLQLLGGTEEYQVYSVIKNYEGFFYILDYKTGKSKEISLHTADGYKKIVPADQEKIFYYEDWEVSPDGEKSSTVWRYDIEKSKEEVLLKKEEIQGAEEESSIRLIGIREDGILCEAGDVLYLVDKDSHQVNKKVSLMEVLPVTDAKEVRLDFVTEDAAYLAYEITNRTTGDESDWISWDGVIRMDDLLNGKKAVKVLIAPRMSSAGNPVDEDGNMTGSK